jgi:hypothetical protein
LTYDYKFPKEDVKIECLCKSSKCRKYLNWGLKWSNVTNPFHITFAKKHCLIFIIILSSFASINLIENCTK